MYAFWLWHLREACTEVLRGTCTKSYICKHLQTLLSLAHLCDSQGPKVLPCLTQLNCNFDRHQLSPCTVSSCSTSPCTVQILRCSPWSTTLKRRGSGARQRLWRSFYLQKISLAPPPAETMWSPWSTFCGRCRTLWRPGMYGALVPRTGSWIHKAWDGAWMCNEE